MTIPRTGTMTNAEPRTVTNAPPRLGSSYLPVPHIAPTLLKARDLRKSFGGQVVLDGVDLELYKGDVVLLRGENGSGKTTLLNILTGNLEPDAGTLHYLADSTPRSYHFPRRWWQDLNPFDHFTPEFVAREGMGRTWQDVRLFATQSLRDNIAVAEPGHPGENPIITLLASRRSARREEIVNRKADVILARLGLAGRETSSADKVSLGQSKRVAIARAVAAGARILFLDEPLAGLDPQGITDILQLLEELVYKNDVTLVIVEHVFNQPHLRRLVSVDWLLAGGKLVVSRPSPNSQSLSLCSGPTRPAFIDLLAGSAAEVIEEPLPRGASLVRIRRADRFQMPPKPVLEIFDLVVKRGSRVVIGLRDCGNPSGFNLTLFEGEIVILQAPNGWGKSTLFTAITGIIKADSGTVRLDGELLNGLSTWGRVTRGLRALPSGSHAFPSLRAREFLGLAGKQVVTINVNRFGNRLCSSLSGGETQLLALTASCSTPNTRTALFDEPFAMLDSTATHIAASLITDRTHASVFILTP